MQVIEVVATRHRDASNNTTGSIRDHGFLHEALFDECCLPLASFACDATYISSTGAEEQMLVIEEKKKTAKC